MLFVLPRQRATSASSLHALLGSVVAATLAGCSGESEEHAAGAGSATRSAVPTTQPADTSEAPAPVDRDPAALVCQGDVPSRVFGLATDYTYDSLAYYDAHSYQRERPDFQLVEQAGEPCSSAPDPSACLAEVERVRSLAATWWHYDNFFSSTWSLLLATNVSGPYTGLLNGASASDVPSATLAVDAGDGPRSGALDAGAIDAGAPRPVLPVTSIDDIDELLLFLSRIDTPNEAALIMFANGRPLPSCAMEREGLDFVASGTWQISDCPITTQRFELRVTPSGNFSEVPLGEPDVSGPCVGRRPDGLCSGESGALATAGAWLAETARLEAAAVAAFALLARELESLDAPLALLARIKRAAREEVAHAALMTALARARGAEPPPAVVHIQARRSLLDIALENAVEGCVRECWGAFCARFQATTAQAPDVRAVFERIAREEAEHAQLSRDIAAWLDARLGPAERDRVRDARSAAVCTLRRELDADALAAVSELGLPSREQALSALDALDRSGLLRAA